MSDGSVFAKNTFALPLVSCRCKSPTLNETEWQQVALSLSCVMRVVRGVNTPTRLQGILQTMTCSIHTGSTGHYTDFVLGSWQGEVGLMFSPTDSDICVLTQLLQRNV